MIYLDINKPKEVVVTVGELATLYTATQSVSNAGQFTYSGQLPLLTFTGYVSSTYTFYSTNIALEKNGQFVQETDYNKLTELVPGSPASGVVLQAKAPTPQGNPDTLWIAISGLNGLWPQYVVVQAGGPDPSIVTVTLPPYFCWKITDADTNQTYLFTNDDTSPAYWNYNQFSFSVIPGATYGATQGVIRAPQGSYIYEIYQTRNRYELNTNGTLMERGILNIMGTTSVINTFTQSDNDTIITFKNL